MSHVHGAFLQLQDPWNKLRLTSGLLVLGCTLPALELSCLAAVKKPLLNPAPRGLPPPLPRPACLPGCRHEKAINYNVTAAVRKKPTRLTLNVKGEGYALHESLQVENADGSVVVLAPQQPNNLDFGQVR